MVEASLKKDLTMDRARATFVILLVATLLLALFHASDLVSWSYDLPINWFTEKLVVVIESWADWMEGVGLTAISEAIGDWIQELQDLEFLD